MASPQADAAQPPPAQAVLERGQSIDRFVVIALVGRGGMGEVYAAYDPELDRKVAIKLLHTRSGAADGRTRLLREAQAIAKLSHPNVVVVYDVGTFGDRVFIAMEFVDGRTLSGWLHAATRSQRDVMRVFLEAGRGLAAAHAAGLVHRDFKPDNVMVTNDGQVRVMDFGLARQTGEAPPVPTGGVTSGIDTSRMLDAAADPDATVNFGQDHVAASSGKYLSIKLTQTGAMLGTPAYMAPEQFAVVPTDARTDQFSFCVALYEFLYGRRPFEGETFVALMTSVTTGAVTPAPAKSRVAGHLRKVVLRGLEVDPDRRYPSMNALLAALQADPTVRRRRIATGLGLAACLALAALGARRITGEQEGLCRRGTERWAGVWESDGAPSSRKDAVRQAFVASGKTGAAQAFNTASRLLDEYVGKWLAMYRDACEATHVRGEQSNEVLDLRMGCLQERLTSASALSQLFSRADATVVDNAVAAAGALPRLERCADVTSLKAIVKPPENEELRRRVEGLRKEMADLVALRDAGHCTKAAGLAETLLPRVRETNYRPLLAEALDEAGLLSNFCVELSIGLKRFKEAFVVALATRHDEAAAKAAILAAGLIADRQGQFAEARDWLQLAGAELERFENHPLLDAWLLNSNATIYYNEGRGPEALRSAQDCLAAKLRIVGPDHPDIPISLMHVGNALTLVGRLEDALATLDDARGRIIRLSGKESSFLAAIESNRSEVLSSLGRYHEAREGFQRTLDIWRAVGSSDPILNAYPLTGLGIAALGEGRPLEAVAPLESALEARTKLQAGPQHLSETRFALARALWARPSERKRARALALDARAALAAATTPAGAAALAKIDAWLKAPDSLP